MESSCFLGWRFGKRPWHVVFGPQVSSFSHKKLVLDFKHMFLPVAPVQLCTQFFKSMERHREKWNVFFHSGFPVASLLLLLSRHCGFSDFYCFFCNLLEMFLSYWSRWYQMSLLYLLMLLKSTICKIKMQTLDHNLHDAISARSHQARAKHSHLWKLFRVAVNVLVTWVLPMLAVLQRLQPLFFRCNRSQQNASPLQRNPNSCYP